MEFLKMKEIFDLIGKLLREPETIIEVNVFIFY